MAVGINDPRRNDAGLVLASNREESSSRELAWSNTFISIKERNGNYVLVIGSSP